MAVFRSRSSRFVVCLGAGLVLLGLASLSSRRVRVWATDETLWTITSLQLPANGRALINLHEVQIQHLDIQGHIETCEKLRAMQVRGRLNVQELWITDRICLSR